MSKERMTKSEYQINKGFQAGSLSSAFLLPFFRQIELSSWFDAQHDTCLREALLQILPDFTILDLGCEKLLEDIDYKYN